MNDLPCLPFEAESVLRTMLSVAGVGGHRVPLPVERELVLSVQHHVLRTALDVDSLEDARPCEVSDAVRDPERRARLVRCAIVVPYVSLEVELAKVAVADGFAMQLGVASTTLRELHRTREAALRRVLLDHARRGERVFLTVHTSAQVRGLVDALRRDPGDDALAAHYRGLRALPVGTLGRALFEFLRARGLPLPGEPGTVDETLVRYDLLRVLGGYELDAAGDLALAGVAAGTPRGHEAALEVLADAHAGAQLRGVAQAGPSDGTLDLSGALAAYERGVAARAALEPSWDFWSLAREDVDELRRRLGFAAQARVRRPTRDTGIERRGASRAA
ncbi:MAG: hypothetical protein AB1689_23605 [Thermodesulfobacteriota bacterium]